MTVSNTFNFYFMLGICVNYPGQYVNLLYGWRAAGFATKLVSAVSLSTRTRTIFGSSDIISPESRRM